jgi:putative ABC transport system permease protein
MFKVTIRGLFTHFFRLILTAIAVIVSVGFMSGTQILTATISTSFDSVFADVYKNIDAVVRSSDTVDTGFDDVRALVSADVIPDVEQVDAVGEVEGQIQAFLAILGKDGEALSNPNAGPPTFGQNWLTKPTLNGWVLKDGRPPTAPTEVVLDSKSAETAGYVVGDTVKIQLNTGVQEFTIVGVAGFGTTPNYAGASAALFDTETAQKLLAEPGKFTWINVSGDDDVSQDELRDRISVVLPPNTEAITGQAFTEESQDAFRQIFNVLGTILLVFGIVALFVGAFIIYNTFSIIVAQRTRELALLRAMGASRRQVLGSVLSETLIVGVISSGFGLLFGVVLAYGYTALLPAIGAGAEDSALTYPPGAFLTSLLVGVIVTVGSGFFPAWRASRVPPVAAMRDVAIDTGGRKVPRLIIGGLLVVVGFASLLTGLFTDTENALALVGSGAFEVILGTVVLAPLFARPLSAIIGSPLRMFTGRLARANAMRNPRRTAATASALMIGVGLVVMFAILVNSIKASVDTAVSDAFTSDLIVDSGSFGQTGLAPSLATEIAAIPGVQAATGIRFGFAEIDGEPAIVLGGDIVALQQAVKFDVVAGSLDALNADNAAITKGMAEDMGLSVGSTIETTFGGGTTSSVPIAAVYDIPLQQQGGLFMDVAAFEKNFPPQFQLDNQIYVKLDPGADVAVVKPQIDALVTAQFPTANVQDLTEFTQSQTAIFDVLLAIITVMLVIAIFIAVLGIINTLLLSVYERTREIGLLRAVGMGRRQVRATITLESVIFSLQGTAIGTVIGFVFAYAIVKAVGTDTEVTFAVPVGQLIAMVIAALIFGVVASIIPAIIGSRMNVLEAIATD